MHFSSNGSVKHYLPLCLACGVARSREGGAVPSGRGSPKWREGQCQVVGRDSAKWREGQSQVEFRLYSLILDCSPSIIRGP